MHRMIVRQRHALPQSLYRHLLSRLRRRAAKMYDILARIREELPAQSEHSYMHTFVVERSSQS